MIAKSNQTTLGQKELDRIDKIEQDSREIGSIVVFILLNPVNPVSKFFALI
jgi:hypothetical protein